MSEKSAKENSKEDGDAESEPSDRDRSNDSWKKYVPAAAIALLVAAALGVGGYLVGKSSGEDLDAARAEGAAAGQKAGTTKGTAAGYEVGFRKGREAGFEATYAPAFRKNYSEAYEDAGLEAPAKNEIKVPKQ